MLRTKEVAPLTPAEKKAFFAELYNSRFSEIRVGGMPVQRINPIDSPIYCNPNFDVHLKPVLLNIGGRTEPKLHCPTVGNFFV